MAGPVSTSADAARAANAQRPSAFAQMSQVTGTGFLNEPYLYQNAAANQDPFYLFAFATDALAKSQAYQQLNQALNKTPSSKPGFNNQFEYLQSLLRSTKLSKSPLTDASALSNIVAAGAGFNQDPFTFLENYAASVKSAGPTQKDTTTQYGKQIQTALQFKDLGDARQYYSDAYFKAWGKFPSADLDTKFQTAWNAQVKDQAQPTTTATKVEYAPIYDKKSKPVIDPNTKKQKVDKYGNKVYSTLAKDQSKAKQYTTITTGVSSAQGEGFTTEEQQQFLTDFLVKNNPDVAWNVDNIGGAAKSIYDKIVELSKANYTKVPSLAEVAPVITKMLGTPDAAVSQEVYNQYQSNILKQTAGKYMSIADYVNAGENADKYIKPMLETVSMALEKNITVDDPFALSIFNFKDDKGNYRMPNALELNKLIMSHPDYAKTAPAVNEAVNMAQSLRSKLGRA